MKPSNGSTLFSLYKKDLLSVKFESLMILATIFLGHLYFSYKILTGWPEPTILGVTSTIFFIVTFVIFIGTFTSVSREWSNNTIYLVMSLPIDGKKIFLSKLLAVMTQLIVLGGTSILVGSLLSSYFLGADIIAAITQFFGFLSSHQLLKVLVMGIILLFFGIIQMILVAFFSTIVGRVFKKFSWLITFFTFIFTNIFIGKINEFLIKALISPLDRHLSIIGSTDFDGQFLVQGGLPTQFFLLQLAVILLISTGLFFLTTTIYDKRIEL